MDRHRHQSTRRPHPKGQGWRRTLRRALGMSTLAVIAIAILGALRVAQPLRFAPAPFAAVLGVQHTLGAKASRNAFGTSQGVSLFESMPSDTMEFPLEVAGDPSALAYRWVPVSKDFPSDTTQIQTLTGTQ